MAYVKTTWATGDVVTAPKLNNMEDGIEANDTAIGSLQTDVDSAETDISSLETRMTTAESDIDALETSVGTKASQSDLAALTNRVAAAETELSHLPDPAASDGTFVVTQNNGKMSLVPLDSDKLDDIIPNNAGAHNAMYRGKYLGTAVTAEQYAAISAGTFEDLFPGDYWTINGVNWRIAHFDYWLRCGDTECTTHHVVIVPDTNLLNGDNSTTHWMNTENITTGAYVGSDWYTGNNDNTGKAQVTTMVENAFGAAHILTHREYLKNATSNGCEAAGTWYDSTIELMTEEMVYGTKEFKNVVNGTTWPANYTIGHGQLALFRHDKSKICNRAAWWLRDVASAARFTYANPYGLADAYDASGTWIGVRTAFGIKA